MKANEKYLIRFLEASDTNFVIPVYQRNYDWKKEHCKQLFDDLISMVENKYNNHFFGAIVSIYNDSSRNREYLIIDGQQRVTTVSLLLLAIFKILDNNKIKTDKIIKEKILNQYLINQYSSDEKKLKLKPIKNDRLAFQKLFEGKKILIDSNITTNYLYFYDRILKEEVLIDELYEAIEKLMVVEIELKNGEDDPQLIFESLNSTGLDLTDADKVRNFILMGKPTEIQEELYNTYWNEVEKNTCYKVTEFIRDYMTIKQGKITNINKVYFSFKEYVLSKNIDIKICLQDMLKFSEYYGVILKSNIGIKDIDDSLKRINKLEVTVSYPFLLEVLDDYYKNTISGKQLLNILLLIESYIFRRIVFKSPTNALNKVFMNLAREIKKHNNYREKYYEVLQLILKNKKSSQKMPNNNEFKKSFMEIDIYNLKAKNKIYLLERLENYKNKEIVDIENSISSKNLTIEHIMPQTLSKYWKESLGENYKEIYEKFINTIGNLTLTGYNSQMSNKPFIEKRDMKDGFKDSRLKLNKYLSNIDKWTDEELTARSTLLFEEALEIWRYPEINDEECTISENIFSLADEDDFTNTKIKEYSFLGDTFQITSWTKLYQDVCLAIYDIEPVKFRSLTNKNFSEAHISKRFSKNENDIRSSFKVSDSIYIEKNLSTEAKIATLRVIFDTCNIEYSELIFTIQ